VPEDAERPFWSDSRCRTALLLGSSATAPFPFPFELFPELDTGGGVGRILSDGTEDAVLVHAVWCIWGLERCDGEDSEE
jgi:hypothetical protein